YNLNHQVTTVAYWRAGTGRVATGRTYYDAWDRGTTQRQYWWQGTGATPGQELEYLDTAPDQLGRPSGEQRVARGPPGKPPPALPGGCSYLLAPRYDRTDQDQQEEVDVPGQGLQTYAYDPTTAGEHTAGTRFGRGSRLQADASYRYGYDDEGNLVR